MSAIITKKSLSRRTVLRGLGVTIALPFLDSMVPALGAQGAVKAPVRRLGVVYLPNGMSMANWTPKAEGAAFELTPVMQPLAAFRERLLVVSGLANKEADPLNGEGTGDHPRAQTAFLTGVHARQTEGADLQAGISMDQIVAREYATQTQLASLELALEANEITGGCENGYSCAYTGTIAWPNETTPLPMETSPRAVFERLFGASDSTDLQTRMARMRQDRSILDLVNTQLGDLKKALGVSDQRKVAEFVDAVRDIERRLTTAEAQGDQQIPAFERPRGVPETFEEYAKLQFDLMALAYQCDLTRVATFLMGREQSVRTYPEIGVPEPHHPTSHHQNRPDMLDKLAKINAYHMTMFAHFLEKLQSTPDGDGSLLDHSMILYGAGISNSDTHLHSDLPLLLAGGGAGQIKGGRHVRFSDKTPMANLHMTLLEKMGVPVEKFADATGKLDMLSGV